MRERGRGERKGIDEKEGRPVSHLPSIITSFPVPVTAVSAPPFSSSFFFLGFACARGGIPSAWINEPTLLRIPDVCTYGAVTIKNEGSRRLRTVEGESPRRQRERRPRVSDRPRIDRYNSGGRNVQSSGVSLSRITTSAGVRDTNSEYASFGKPRRVSFHCRLMWPLSNAEMCVREREREKRNKRERIIIHGTFHESIILFT